MTIARVLIKLIATIFLAATAFSGWSQTGGTIGGLLPAPKILNGTLVEGVYTPPNGEFRISAPHKDGTNEFLYMQVKEQFHPQSTYLSFGPAALDRKIFRVEVSKISNPSAVRPPLLVLAEKAFPAYLGQVERGYGFPTQRVVLRETGAGDQKAVFGLYKQEIQAQRKLFGPDIAAETRMHALYLVDYGSHGAFFWVEVPQATQEVVTELEAQTFHPLNAFVSSLTVQR